MILLAWKRCTPVVASVADILKLIAVTLFLASACWAQLPPASDTTSPPNPGVGHDYIHAPVETVNPANGSVSIRIPVRVSPGRELTIPLSVAYDSTSEFYYGLGVGMGTPGYAKITNVPFSTGGWSYTLPFLTFLEESWMVNNGSKNLACTGRDNYVFQDPTGNRHDMDLLQNTSVGAYADWCGSDTSQTGGEGPILAVTGGGTEPPVTVTDGNGTVYSFGGSLATTLPSTITDRNGNYISVSSGSQSASYTDTFGRTAVSISTTGNPNTIDVAQDSDLNGQYQVYWTGASASFDTTLTET
jgi:hypothetical protein